MLYEVITQVDCRPQRGPSNLVLNVEVGAEDLAKKIESGWLDFVV